MDKNELESAKLDFALANTPEKKAAWAERYDEDLMRHIEEMADDNEEWEFP